MSRHREDDYEEEEDDEEIEEEENEDYRRRTGGRKRVRSDFIDDAAIEDDHDKEYKDEEDENEELYGGRGQKYRKRGSEFFDLEAQVDSDDEEEEDEEAEDDFINDAGTDLPDESGGRRAHRPLNMMPEDQEDVEEMERQVYERYAKSSHIEYGEDATEVEQQDLLPSVKDPKLWLVKCAIGRERETAMCLMQKFMDMPGLHIRSVVALDFLKNYIYVEADKEAHVKEACKGLRTIYSSAKVMLVPIKEMTDVLSVKSKTIEISRDTWVRMKLGIYKGDLAKVVDVDDVRQKVTVKLIPRIDLQHIANKLRTRKPPMHAFVARGGIERLFDTYDEAGNHQNPTLMFVANRRTVLRMPLLRVVGCGPGAAQYAKQEHQKQQLELHGARETGSLPRNDLMGHGKDKELVMEWLRNPSNEHRVTTLYRNISLPAIVGHGGMGEDNFQLKRLPVSAFFNLSFSCLSPIKAIQAPTRFLSPSPALPSDPTTGNPSTTLLKIPSPASSRLHLTGLQAASTSQGNACICSSQVQLQKSKSPLKPSPSI
ncbi:putative transcription elongation factor SPT5 homolog 1 [Dendrobium catenatum]|uniref:putative transcription elongation factor SPT5 homolog 1 n=1 Tax=Dendrobium catenatum TaxID=906689 RepID=UPI00109F1F23|nr:putative transcription elongation factor SPT5 homolog 1 [Dendrobium catenatum]